jgi:NADH-quinone oxidoreductase subunit E
MTTALATALPRVDDQDLIDRIIGEQGSRPGALLGILEKLQDANRHKYLPMETLEYVALRTGVPQSQVYAVATFYALFNLDPQGTHTVAICRGTACHTRGSRDLLETATMRLGLRTAEDGETESLSVTTPDGAATLRTVACFGQCALAPVVEVNHTIFGHMNERSLLKALDALDKGGRPP